MFRNLVRKVAVPLTPLVKYFSEKKQTRNNLPTKELGFGGSGAGSSLSSLPADEYLPEISFPHSLFLYNKMRRSDSTIQAVEYALTLPIRATDWRVEEGGSSPSAKQAADLINETFFGGMTITFDDFLREALLALFYGFVPFEKVYEQRNGLWTYRKLAPRHPATVECFLFAPDGGLEGIRQSGVDPTGRWRQVTIPIDKLLLFIWRREFGNPYGFSLLRPIYKHWLLKDIYYKLQGVALERWSAGIAVGKVPRGTSESDRNLLLSVLEKLRTHDRAALVLPEDFSVEILGGQVAATQAFSEAIQHHDTMMVKGVLAQFLNLGQGDIGSWALSRDHSQLFLLSLNAVAQWFADIVNRYAIQPLCQINFGQDFDEFPRLTFTDLRMILHRDDLARTVAELISRSALSPDRSLQDFLRNLLDLPRSGD
ncbi:MAG: DUF935 domain-containing protein [Armatimonadetes bacterium]|nr:DUF935 domain-containing protein [Armatimonadota bacterium]MDW8122435.1 DUF935 family protein [Armatimonadota bacterium]